MTASSPYVLIISSRVQKRGIPTQEQLVSLGDYTKVLCVLSMEISLALRHAHMYNGNVAMEIARLVCGK